VSQLKLISLRIEGHRKFDARLVLDLRGPSGAPLDYLVLAGPNGCGKTTVLDAILLTLGREALIVRDLDPADRARSVRLHMAPAARLQAWVHDERAGATFWIERSAAGTEVRAPIGDHQYTAPTWQTFQQEVLNQLAVEYISARRLPAQVGPVQDRTSGRGPAPTEANRIWTFKDRLRKQQGRRVAGYRGPEPLDRLWLDKLNAYWAELRPDGTSFAMTLVDPDDLDANDWDVFLYRGEERICPIDALSSGEQEVLAMAMPFITEPFDGLLLIDEPELHLHPQWQGRVLRGIRRLVPGAQVIVATHADDPWDDAMSWERRLLVDAHDPRAAAPRGGQG
jgi:energy-coupling factor transporter ATP-binding protein EcfA2